MNKMQLGKKTKNLSYKNIFSLIFALTAFFILLTSIINLSGKYFNLKKRNNDLIEEKTRLQEKEEVLKNQNNAIETDTGRSLLLREKYNSVSEGENLIIITELEQEKYEKESIEKTKKWWYFF